jgi:membrane protein DedA with SNARE-associated domain
MSLTEISAYAGFFAVLVMAGFGFGPPEEIALPAAGIFAGANPEIRWWILLPVCIAGVLLADMFLYGVGRWQGDRLLNYRWMARLVPPARRRQIEKNFHDYGIGILIGGRLVPGVRAPLFLTAGAIRLPLLRFLIADGLGAIVGNSLLFLLGFWLGDQFSSLWLVREAERLRPILIVVVLGGVAAYVLYLFLRHPVATGDLEEVPLIGHQLAEHLKTEEGHEPDSKAPPAGANGQAAEIPEPTASEARPGP